MRYTLVVLLSGTLIVVSALPFSSVVVSVTASDLGLKDVDMNGDGIIDIVDIAIVSSAFRSFPGAGNWNARADLNNDSTVNIVDVCIIAPFFRQSLNTYNLGLWDMGSGDWMQIPESIRWVFTYVHENSPSESSISLILNWYSLRRSQPSNYFYEEEDLKRVETAFKELNVTKYWGIIFISEETYRSHVAFYDSVNITWFGENLCGYAIYKQENPHATSDQWKDEMFLRMTRGFFTYFHEKGTKVGITAHEKAASNHLYCYGEPAANFIKDNYDFVVLYAYTLDLDDFNSRTKTFFDLIDSNFQKQKKFWIITRIFDDTPDNWEPEAIALEMKNCFDRGIVVTSYVSTSSPFRNVTDKQQAAEQVWHLFTEGNKLYNANVSYFESYVNGTNLLTRSSGLTYGWVKPFQ
jgi:hypothetical protein